MQVSAILLELVVAQVSSGFAGLRQRKRWLEALLVAQQPLVEAEAAALAKRKPLLSYIAPPPLVESMPHGIAAL